MRVVINSADKFLTVDNNAGLKLAYVDITNNSQIFDAIGRVVSVHVCGEEVKFSLDEDGTVATDAFLNVSKSGTVQFACTKGMEFTWEEVNPNLGVLFLIDRFSPVGAMKKVKSYCENTGYHFRSIVYRDKIPTVEEELKQLQLMHCNGISIIYYGPKTFNFLTIIDNAKREIFNGQEKIFVYDETEPFLI
jgi:hypothetical protein